MKFFVCCLALFGASALASNVDYCAVKSKMCGGLDHWGCEPNTFTPNGRATDQEFIELTQEQKDMMLNLHNNLRNQLAGGAFADLGFPASSNLTEIKWNDDLEYMANVHVRYGDYRHDACRATPDFPYAGQNLAIIMQLPTYPEVNYALQRSINLWFDEINIADPALISSMENAYMAAGHFTVMVHHLTQHVGCGATNLKYSSNGRIWNAVMVTCNYSYTNMLGDPVYYAGDVAAGCKAVSEAYPAMCANK